MGTDAYNKAFRLFCGPDSLFGIKAERMLVGTSATDTTDYCQETLQQVKELRLTPRLLWDSEDLRCPSHLRKIFKSFAAPIVPKSSTQFMDEERSDVPQLSWIGRIYRYCTLSVNNPGQSYPTVLVVAARL